jgi:NYN domain
VRRCYLNPQVYQRFRPAFNRAGFEIIDCPAMTSEGKTSTDIHMVLDIVDLLQHQVHYDEFIVFSADADFTPVLRKLRRWDRRTTVLAIGFPSAAYQASADLLIDQDEFMRAGLGFDEPEPTAPPSIPVRAKSDVARDVASYIAKAVASSGKPVSLPWIASKLPAEVKGLDAADWAGFTNFRTLVDSLKLDPLVVKWDAGVVLDPARHAGLERNAGPSNGGAQAVNGLAAISQLIRDEVRTAGRPVPCGRLAQIIIDRQGAIAADWGGKGTFRRLLESLELGSLAHRLVDGGWCRHRPGLPQGRVWPGWSGKGCGLGAGSGPVAGHQPGSWRDRIADLVPRGTVGRVGQPRAGSGRAAVPAVRDGQARTRPVPRRRTCGESRRR